jgi:hypothetical protein
MPPAQNLKKTSGAVAPKSKNWQSPGPMFKKILNFEINKFFITFGKARAQITKKILNVALKEIL